MARTAEETAAAGADSIEPIHLCIALCESPNHFVRAAFADEDVNPVTLAAQLRDVARRMGGERRGGHRPTRVSERVLRLIGEARTVADSLGGELDARCVMVALFERPGDALAPALRGVPTAALAAHARHGQRARREERRRPERPPPPRRRDGPPPGAPGETPLIDQIAKDYTALARAGKIDPVIGRNEETKQLVRALLRKSKNNPVLVGEPGVGKTAIVEGLANRIVADDAPEDIAGIRIVEISVSALVAKTEYRGQFEERLEQLVEEAEHAGRLVLFFDEIHTLVGAGAVKGALDASNILKPALARGVIRCIGATTPREYREYIEKDPALERRLQPVAVEEPAPDAVTNILRGIRPSYERHHGVSIADEALDAAVELSIRYLPDRRLPDKACDLLDQAAVAKRFLSFSHATPAGGEIVLRDDVAKVLAQWTGIPVERLTVDRAKRLLTMEDELRRRVIGQDEAIAAVADVVRTASAGLSNPKRPHGVFLFAGPTGVGKTEVARALAELLFDDEEHLIRFDMSELMEKHSVSKLIGSPPGYHGHEEGGRLTNAIRRKPYCVVLFDEVEKAHPRVTDIFLQMFDDGRVTDSHGRVADFRNAVIILTTNLGADADVAVAKRRVGFDAGSEAPPPADERVRQAVMAHLRPELVNRIDRIVAFRRLGREQLVTIVEKLLDRIRTRLAGKRITLELAPEAYEALLEKGFDPRFGARELERVMEREIVQKLARGLLDGSLEAGGRVVVGVRDGAFRLSTD